MENIELIAAKDLPITEAEEVEVLCVDPATGAMARKAGAGLGGTGLYVIKGYTEDFLEAMVSGQLEITSISYDDFAQHWYDGGMLALDVKTDVVSATLYPIAVSYVPAEAETAAMMVMIVFGIGDSLLQVAFANGTWTPPAV